MKRFRPRPGIPWTTRLSRGRWFRSEVVVLLYQGRFPYPPLNVLQADIKNLKAWCGRDYPWLKTFPLLHKFPPPPYLPSPVRDAAAWLQQVHQTFGRRLWVPHYQHPTVRATAVKALTVSVGDFRLTWRATDTDTSPLTDGGSFASGRILLYQNYGAHNPSIALIGHRLEITPYIEDEPIRPLAIDLSSFRLEPFDLSAYLGEGE